MSSRLVVDRDRLPSRLELQDLSAVQLTLNAKSYNVRSQYCTNPIAR